MEGRTSEKANEYQVITRPFDPSDFKYIVKTWLNDFKDSKWAGVVPNNVYRKVYGETLRQLFRRGMKVEIMCDPDYPRLVLGFVAYEDKPSEKVLHYIYLIDRFRKHGYAKKLLTEVGFDINQPIVHTFRTFDFINNFEGRHRPEIARRKEA